MSRPVALLRRRRIRSLGVVLALVLAALGLGVPAAQAHDELIGTTPSDGSSTSSVPASISLRFNETPEALGAQVQILDPSGADQADGSVSITDATATQKIKAGAPAGAYTVHWRVVSADSHPIEGTFRFTAKGGSTASAATGSGTSAGSAGSSAAAASSPAAAPASSTGGSRVPVIVIVVGVLLLVGFGIWMVVSGRRRREDDAGQ
ncbi:copper resistance CopC family protein [Tersicoccus sp. MR15.9]|uniref:copper resistance CopC family protein n=1 Tax=Tersicoccus mangrovi TaxID=3121635 RepID=UPI002FE5B39C